MHLFFILFLFFLSSCVSAQTFSDATHLLPTNSGYGNGSFGGGVSFVDFDNDGWDDLTFATTAGKPLLFYKNNQGVFQPIASPVEEAMEAKQVLWADIDNDGDQDLFVSNNGAPNRLYRNEGDWNFTDITFLAGIPYAPDETFGASFGDYDKDGFLDLYIVNRSATYTNYLLRNRGNGMFQNVSLSAKASDGKKPSFCAAFLDYDQDGWADIYIAQDKYSVNNTLLKNRGDGTFMDVSIAAGADMAIDAMNVGVADYDNDQDMDIYVTNTEGGNQLLQNQGDGTFTEVSEVTGTGFYAVGWGANFVDVNLDGWQDIYTCSDVSNRTNALFLNQKNGTFLESSIHSNDDGKSYANAVGDFNQDGLPDLVINVSGNESMRLWQNKTLARNHFLQIKLIGTTSNRDGIGTYIEAFAGTQQWTHYTYSGIAYLGQNANTQTLGIGRTTLLDSLRITWTSGIVDVYENIEADKFYTLTENETNEIVSDTKNWENHAINWTIFPNPMINNHLSLNFQNNDIHFDKILIMNTLGELVFSKKIKLKTAKHELKDLSLPNGIYFLSLLEKGKTWSTKRLIKL